ncbi:hypothetical protein [Gluconobacter kondonii]|uniref:Uncharacterized protein n=1 Tax=Gluconobacter kondonii TaxID=941463 RepID=A0ABQ5WTT0_9PROT|nr:hypothetical protein [Gluconobacter kondonii]GBR36405.1 hypothetical protein AA3266_2385 [Gluconobacter kondonii NBRC 3266]GLQ66945.1 hypothetical protein GCM10007870_25300 [Gluconobacter kondonii]
MQYEQQFGCTIKRTVSLEQLAEQGTPYAAALAAPDLARACLSSRPIPTVLTPAWEFPAGAFGQGAGPT